MLQQQPYQCIAMRMCRTIFFTFADRPDKRRVSAVTGHEEGVWVRAGLKQQTRDRQGVVSGFIHLQSRETEVKQRLPILRGAVLEDVLGMARGSTARGFRGTLLAR